jgi:hypothetical protein
MVSSQEPRTQPRAAGNACQYCMRKLHVTPGEVELQIPKLQHQRVNTHEATVSTLPYFVRPPRASSASSGCSETFQVRFNLSLSSTTAASNNFFAEKRNQSRALSTVRRSSSFSSRSVCRFGCMRRWRRLNAAWKALNSVPPKSTEQCSPKMRRPALNASFVRSVKVGRPPTGLSTEGSGTASQKALRSSSVRCHPPKLCPSSK